MKLRFLLLAVAGIAIICSGCCACKRAQKAAKPLVGTTWHLVQIGGNDVALPEDTFNVTFGADGRVFGIGGYRIAQKLFNFNEGSGSISIPGL